MDTEVKLDYNDKHISGAVSAYAKRRRNALAKLPAAEQMRIAMEVYKTIMKNTTKDGGRAILPFKNEISFKSSSYKLVDVGTNTSFMGGYPRLLWEILMASEEVLSKESL